MKEFHFWGGCVKVGHFTSFAVQGTLHPWQKQMHGPLLLIPKDANPEATSIQPLYRVYLRHGQT